MTEKIVEVIRRFSPMSPRSMEWDFLMPGPGRSQGWHEIENEFRVLIIADPGAGKTFEAQTRARRIKERGRHAFFIRIEKIDATFDQSFEVGTPAEFAAWLASTDEAWFFLDSVDEAQLETPRALENAVRIFGARIHAALDRARIFITSREDAWRALPDQTLIEQHLPYGEPTPHKEDHDTSRGSDPTLKLFRLAGLSEDQIGLFAGHYSVGDVTDFVDALKRADLFTLAERPFDLKALIRVWNADHRLGSRFEVLQRMISLQIKALSAATATIRHDAAKIRYGARILAGTVTMTGKAVISLPWGVHSADRIDPRTLLTGWSDSEVNALLRTGLFDDVVYNSVRFRHREIRELLTAEWAYDLLGHPSSRSRVEDLFFRESYGEQVIVPRTRPTLVWLILFDNSVRDKALALAPEIAGEGGDPSRLPLVIRQGLLRDISDRIAIGREGGLMDNSAIARIAAPDLASDALALLETHRDNDDVIIFLGRLVWQGQMASCAPALLEIAIDTTRGKYARISAIRGVMAAGGETLRTRLWNTIADDPGPLDRAILSQFVEWAAPNTASVSLISRTLSHTAPYERFNATGLGYSLHQFVDKLPVKADAAADHPLGRLVDCLSSFLDREPFVERGDCHVSEEFMWLMPIAIHAVDRLVAARSAQALRPASIAVLRNLPALRFWRRGDFDDYKTSLDKNLPRWRELNDLLYWTSVAACRAHRAASGETLTDDWPMAYLGHFWRFGAEDFERCLEWVATKEGDDRAVALSRCLRIYVDADRPSAWLAPLRAAVADDAVLAATLEARLDPKPSPAMIKIEAENRRWKRESDARKRRQEKDRADWVRALKANPDRILHSAGLNPGEFSSDRYHILCTMMSGGTITSRDNGANWRALVPEFGESVARAFRDAAVAHWRVYRPTLRSEGGETGSTPYSLIFAMTGLMIEALEDRAFAQQLTEDEAKLAFRYVTWQLNGFPAWFEPLYRAFPELGREAVTTELGWELAHSVGEQSLHYILHDILYHAPWLHGDVAPLILERLGTPQVRNADALRYCLNILAGSNTAPEVLGALAAKKATDATLESQRPRWLALWIETDPAAAIPTLEEHLEAMSPADASAFAQLFIVALLGDRHGTGKRFGAYRNAGHLKRLHVLMHRHIRTAEDLNRAGTGVYSPTLRDNAQDGRDTLFKMLVEVPGPEAYTAIRAIEEEHPEAEYRRWITTRARQRAAQDADEPLWTVEQVSDFSTNYDA